MNISESTFDDVTIDMVMSNFPSYVINGRCDLVTRADVERVARAIRMDSTFTVKDIANRSKVKNEIVLRVVLALCEGHGVVEVTEHGRGSLCVRREFTRVEHPRLVPLFRPSKAWDAGTLIDVFGGYTRRKAA